MNLKKNWILFPVVLLVMAGLVMMGCSHDANHEGPPGPNPPGPGPDSEFDPSTITPPAEYDTVLLRSFTSGVGNGTTQKGWASNGLNGAATDVEVWDFIEAKFLYIWVKNEPAGGMQIAWQGDGEGVSKTGWFQSDVLTSNGEAEDDVTVKAEQDGYAITIDLDKVLSKKDVNSGPDTAFTQAIAGVKFILGYYTGGGLNSLGNTAVYLLLEKDSRAARQYFNVTFDSKGGPAVGGLSVCKDYPLGGKYPQPELADKVLDVWKEGSTEYTAYTPITKDTALEAVWLDAKTVTFNFQGDGTNVTVIVGQGKTLNSSDIPKPTVGTVSGKAFDGWFNEAGCTSAADFTAAISADKTYYAKWVTPVTVTFALAGGVLANGQTTFGNVTIPEGTAIGADKFPANPVKIGHTFDGWKDGSNAAITSSTPIDTNATVTAQWTKTATYLLSLGAMDITNGDKQNGWLFGTGGADIAGISAAKYLVIKIDGNVAGNPWGIGGSDIILQPGGNGWEQKKLTEPVGGWEGLNFKDKIIYFVIDLSSHPDWGSTGATEGTKLFIQTWEAINSMGITGAYLINNITGNSIMTFDKDITGFITNDNLGF